MRMLALVGALLLVIVAFFHGYVEKQHWFSIEKITLKGELTYLTEDELMTAYDSLLGRSLLQISLAEVFEITNTPPWVESTSIRRVWPNELRIYVVEHTPLAFWRTGQIITASGRVIAPSVRPDLPLPHLSGPVGAEQVALEQFGLVSQVLSSSGLRVQSLTLEARGSWTVAFFNGLLVRLGREEILERLQRFIAVYKTDLSGRIDKIISVDARYPHGIAVEWLVEP